jgi:uncharacterized protein (DUF849 family)
MAKVMIEAAINGNAMKDLNPNIPYSPEEIATDAIATCQAGAALIHFHVRNPDTGAWVQDLPYYSEVYKRTREKCDPLLWPTFPFGDDPARRFQHFFDLAKDPGTKPDLGAGDMGSVNLVSYDPITKNLGEGNFVYQNSYDTIKHFLEGSNELGLRPTLQIFDASFFARRPGLLRQRRADRAPIAEVLFWRPDPTVWPAPDPEEPRSVSGYAHRRAL